MSLDRSILAVVESKPVATAGVQSVLSTWAFWQIFMERGTTVLSFSVALGGAVLFVYNLRAARRKRRIKANLPCAKCGFDRD